MPATAEAFSQGELSPAKVKMLAAAREVNPERFASDEETLVGIATDLDVATSARAVAHWKTRVEPAKAADTWRRQHDARYLSISPTLDGSVRLDGLLDPVAGETVLTAVKALTDHGRAPDDTRTETQRRADALTDLCRHYLDHPARPTFGGEKPHISLIVDLNTLSHPETSSAGEVVRSAAELSLLGPITAASALRIACDSTISRIITNGPSQILEVGRKTRTIPPAIRKAIILRDKTCRWPGCRKPAPYCDVHHLLHWIDGGRTGQDNGLLLCGHHHILTHEHGYKITGNARNPIFTRPDGTIIDFP
jgi:hypothetical protein